MGSLLRTVAALQLLPVAPEVEAAAAAEPEAAAAAEASPAKEEAKAEEASDKGAADSS